MSNFKFFMNCGVITGFLFVLNHAIKIFPLWSISLFSIEIFLIASYAAFKQVSIDPVALKLTRSFIISSIIFASAPSLIFYLDVDQHSSQSDTFENLLLIPAIAWIIIEALKHQIDDQ